MTQKQIQMKCCRPAALRPSGGAALSILTVSYE